MLKEPWSRIKLGAVPLILISIPVGLVLYLWGRVDALNNRLHFNLTGNGFFNVPASFLILLATAWLLGSLFKMSWLKSFGEKHFLKVPLIGGILFILIIDRKLELIEVRTAPGMNLESGGFWEYAVVTKDPWLEDGITWYGVHTLGLTSNKLASRVSMDIVRPLNKSQREALLTVLSMGLL